MEGIMPKWTREPPAHKDLATLPILRAPPRGVLVGQLTSYEMVGCPIHWWRGRSLPCEDHKCPACQNKVPFRWKGYLGFWQPAQSQHSLLEIPAAAADTVADFRLQNPTLRHAIVELKRVPEKANGRVLLRIKPGPTDAKMFPQPPDTERLLAKIWDLPAITADDTIFRRTAPKIKANRDGFSQNLFVNADNDSNLAAPNSQ